MLAWRAAHPEEYKERLRKYRKRWRKSHPDYFRDWQVENREYVTMMKRQWRAKQRAKGIGTRRLTGG